MEARRDLPAMTPRIKKLPVNDRGYPVPWFASWFVGNDPVSGPEVAGAKPDFRIVGADKRVRAIRESRCWVCGEKLGVHKAFVIGPMCAINKTTAEPPCHQDCAEWSAIACPFLSRPEMRRREESLPVEKKIDGNHLDRNPGCMLVWTTPHFSPFRVDDEGGWLIRLGKPEQIRAFAEGRLATLAEVMESIRTGYPHLEEAAIVDGPEGMAALVVARLEAEKLIAQHVRV